MTRAIDHYMAMAASVLLGCSFDVTGVSPDPLDAALADASTLDATGVDAPRLEPSLALGDTRLLVHVQGALALESWRRDIQTRAWQLERMTAVVPGKTLFVVNRVARDGSGDEVFAGLHDDTGQLVLATQHAPAGGPWQPGWSANVSGDPQTRRFDVEFEESGHVLVAYAPGDNKPRYRTYASGTWSEELTAPITAGGNLVWIELAPRPGTDEIAMAAVDENEDLWLAIWDGEDWDNASVQMLFDAVKPNATTGLVQNPVVDLAYETGGQLVVVWGDENAGGFKLSTRDPGANATAPVAVASPSGGTVHAIDLTRRPGTDEMAMIASDLGDGQERLGVALWDGTAAFALSNIDDQINDVNDTASGDSPSAITWIGDTAVGIYPDNQDGTLDWVMYSNGAWASQSGVPIAGKGRTESALFSTLHDGNQAVAVLSDDGGRLYAVSRIIESWNIENQGEPITDTLSTIQGVPFSIDVRLR